jgi:hypothetical protein
VADTGTDRTFGPGHRSPPKVLVIAALSGRRSDRSGTTRISLRLACVNIKREKNIM